MNSKCILVDRENEVATIILNRPKVKNAINYDMWGRLAEVLEEVNSDSDSKVVVIKGVNETVFSSGADIKEFVSLRSTSDGARKYNMALKKAIDLLAELGKPTIAIVQGHCIGGGFEIALACDIRIADETTKFALTPAKIGLINNLTSIKHLVDLVGPSKAKDLIYSGRLIGYKEAIAIGVIDRFFQSDEIINRAYQYAQLIGSNAQMTVQGSKRIINALTDKGEIDPTLEQIVSQSFVSEDYQEGVKAFIEKRKPQFKANRVLF